MSRITRVSTVAWEHHDGQGNVTILEWDRNGGYFVPGFYGDGEPRFRTLEDVRWFIDEVQSHPALPDHWTDLLR